LLTNFIVDAISSKKEWVEINGVMRRQMNMDWIWGVLVGIVLSPLMLIVYNKARPKHRIMEVVTTTMFLVITTVVYLIYEV